MFEIVLRKGHHLANYEKMFEVKEFILDMLCDYAFMSEHDITETYCADSSRSSKYKGWYYEDLGKKDSIQYAEMENGDFVIKLPDSRKKKILTDYNDLGGGEKAVDLKIDVNKKEGLHVPDYFDSVKMPRHYTEGRKYEPWKVIADWGLDFCLGNAVKYIARAGRKGGEDKKKEDLQKAIQYLQFELWYLEGKF